MFKIPLIMAATCSIALGEGDWTKTSLRAAAAIPAAPVSISPFEIHLNVNPPQLPVQHSDYI